MAGHSLQARRYGERTPLHEALEEKEDQLMEAQFVIVELAMENRTLKGRLDTVSKRAEMLESSIMQVRAAFLQALTSPCTIDSIVCSTS